MTRRHRSRRPEEAGFTLIEIVVVIAVMGLVVGALAAALIGTWRSDDATFQRLAKSHDAQLTAGYFVTDAQSSGGTGNVSVIDKTTCQDPSIVDGATYSIAPVVMMMWSDTDMSPTTVPKAVSYVLVTNNTTTPKTTTLMRRYCRGAGLPLVDDTTVGHYAASATASCSPAPGDCTGTPQTVTLTVTETQAASEPQPYVFSLTGEFRQVPPNGTPIPPPSVPWVTLGSDSACDGTPSTNIEVGSQLTVNGSGTVASNGTIAGTPAPSGTPILQSPTTPVPDPYRVLPAPSTSGLQTFSDGDLTHGPGVYRGSSIDLTSAVALAPGIYILRTDLSLSGSAALTGSNVMLYVRRGTYSVGDQATVSLSAPTSGTYKGIVIFEASSNSNDLSLTGDGNSTYAGTVYAPDASVMTSGMGVATASNVVAQCGDLTGSGGVTVGS